LDTVAWAGTLARMRRWPTFACFFWKPCWTRFSS
jgi:hypothetical protein